MSSIASSTLLGTILELAFMRSTARRLVMVTFSAAWNSSRMLSRWLSASCKRANDKGPQDQRPIPSLSVLLESRSTDLGRASVERLVAQTVSNEHTLIHALHKNATCA